LHFADHASNAGSLAIAADRVAQTVIDGFRSQCMNEGLTVRDREDERMVFLDRAEGILLVSTTSVRVRPCSAADRSIRLFCSRGNTPMRSV
jgi:hypothetical protein